jgi:hypothetical protein
MNIESVMRLSAPVQIMAALGAELRLRQEGLDTDPQPALSLARENLVESGAADRVELRLQRVEDLDEAESSSLAWHHG